VNVNLITNEIKNVNNVNLIKDVVAIVNVNS